jgi:hypothetical protein
MTWAAYFFFFAAFFFAGAFFFAVAIMDSPPILYLSTTIAHLLPGKLSVKNIFKTCHTKIQNKN